MAYGVFYVEKLLWKDKVTRSTCMGITPPELRLRRVLYWKIGISKDNEIKLFFLQKIDHWHLTNIKVTQFLGKCSKHCTKGHVPWKYDSISNVSVIKTAICLCYSILTFPEKSEFWTITLFSSSLGIIRKVFFFS